MDEDFGSNKLKDEKSNQILKLNWYPEYSPFNVPYIVGEALDHISFVVVENADNTVNQLVEKRV
jgi:hypothetical protein